MNSVIPCVIRFTLLPIYVAPDHYISSQQNYASVLSEDYDILTFQCSISSLKIFMEIQSLAANVQFVFTVFNCSFKLTGFKSSKHL